MKNLLSTELFRIFRQRKTYYAIGAVFILEAIIMISAYIQGREILDLLLENLTDTFEFNGNLLNGNLIVYLVLNSFWFHIPLILMVVVSGFLTSEYQDRTVEAVLLQPVSKLKFIGAKYIAALLFTGFMLAVLIGTTFLFAYLVFGNGDLVVYLEGLSFFEPEAAFNRLAWAFAAGSATMLFYAVVSLTFAVLLREATATWIVAALFLLVTTLLLRFDFGSDWVNTYFFPKLTDTWQALFYVEIPWDAVIIKTLCLLGYSALAALLGMVVFVKRDIK